MIPLIETLEINLWLKFLIDATMKSFAIFAVAGLLGFILRRHSAAVRGLEFVSRGKLGCAVIFVRTSAMGSWRSTGNIRAISGRQQAGGQITCFNSGGSVTIRHFINPSYSITDSIELHDQREWCSSI